MNGDRKLYREYNPTPFAELRGDNWFTSLWALQEVVLSPAAIWMTLDGGICYINEQILTTRLFAIAIRLLYWAERWRARKWIEAKQCYMDMNNMSEKAFSRLVDLYDGKDLGRETALRAAFKAHLAQYQQKSRALAQSSNTSSSRLSLVSMVSHKLERPPHSQIEDSDIRVETHSAVGNHPWVIARHIQQGALRSDIQHWTAWSFGTACIDVAISATRAAIILASTSRDVVSSQPREQALLAALKVEPLPAFVARANPESRHLCTYLMDLILVSEGAKLSTLLTRHPSLALFEKTGMISTTQNGWIQK